MMVVCRSQIRIALLLGFGDLLRQHRRPFRPCEMAGFVKLHRHGEGLRLPWLAERRFVSRGFMVRPQVVVPQIDIDRVICRRRVAPQVAPLKRTL